MTAMRSTQPADTLGLMKRLKNAYPRQVLSTGTLAEYASGLQDFPYQAVARAVDNVIRTSRWFPAIAEIRGEAAELLTALPTSTQALEMVAKCSITHPLVKRAAHAAIGESWCYDYKQSTNIVGLRRQFLETYRELREQALRAVQLDPQTFLGGNSASIPALPGGRNSEHEEARSSPPGGDGIYPPVCDGCDHPVTNCCCG